MPIHIGIEVGKKTPHTRTVRSWGAYCRAERNPSLDRFRFLLVDLLRLLE